MKSQADENEWDRAIAAEARRCRRMGLIFSQPACGWREDDYGVGDTVRLGNVNGVIAMYRVTPTGRIRRLGCGVAG